MREMTYGLNVDTVCSTRPMKFCKLVKLVEMVKNGKNRSPVSQWIAGLISQNTSLPNLIVLKEWWHGRKYLERCCNPNYGE